MKIFLYNRRCNLLMETNMDYSVLEKSPLFQGISEKDFREVLAKIFYRIQRYEKGELIFRPMEPATRIAVILEGRVEIQKSLPNGNQVNVSQRGAGEMIGTAAVFSKTMKYPCGIAALEPVRVMIFQKEDFLKLMQADLRILENFTSGLASVAYMLQQRLELFSYSGIAQKAVFWLLIQAGQTGKKRILIPGSVSKWAMLMNVSRPSLHRELKRLEEQSLISYMPPVIDILDPDGLKKILDKIRDH